MLRISAHPRRYVCMNQVNFGDHESRVYRIYGIKTSKKPDNPRIKILTDEALDQQTNEKQKNIQNVNIHVGDRTIPTAWENIKIIQGLPYA